MGFSFGLRKCFIYIEITFQVDQSLYLSMTNLPSIRYVRSKKKVATPKNV